MTPVHERLETADWSGFARLTQRISAALLANSYRDDPEAWRAEDESETHLPDILPSLGATGRAGALLRAADRVAERALDVAARCARRSVTCAGIRFVRLRARRGGQPRGRAARRDRQLQPAGGRDLRRLRHASQYDLPDLRAILTPHLRSRMAQATDEDLGTLLAKLLRQLPAGAGCLPGHRQRRRGARRFRRGSG